MLNFFSNLNALSWSNIWATLTSTRAIIIYLIVLLCGIALVVIFAMLGEARNASMQEHSSDAEELLKQARALNEAKKAERERLKKEEEEGEE